jgi:predicted Zn-dependent peptidase
MKINTLKNGINTIFCNKNTSDLVVVGFVCKTGYIDEYKNFPNGITLIIEKLFLKGTHKNPSVKKIWNAIESIGGRWYSETDSEILSFYILLPQENQFKGISLISEIIQKSYFEEKDIEECKTELTEELKSVRKGTNVNFGLENLYTCFPYSQKKVGSIDQIMSINQSIILDYLARQLRPANCYISISGNYQLKACQELIEQEWSYWLPTVRKAEDIYFDYQVCKNDLPKIPFLQAAKMDTDLNINFLLSEGVIAQELTDNIELTDKSLVAQIQDNFIERLAIYAMIIEILVGGNTGRLYTKLISEEKLVNHIQAELIQFSLSGCLSIYANIDNQNFNQALATILETFEELRRNIINGTELLKVKEMTKLSLLLLKEDLLNFTVFSVKQMVLSGNSIDINDIITKVNYIESAQIRSFCLEIFSSSNISLSLIGTNKEGKYIEKLLEKHLG